MPLRVLLLGRTQILYETALRLSRNHPIAGMVTAPAASEYSRTEKDFEALARRLGCPFRCTSRLDDSAIEWVAGLRPDIAVSLNWPSIIDDRVISKIPLGILNAHFGDLPRYRGNAVINWALLRCEKRIALTIHKMIPGELDSGDILLQRHMELSSSSTIRDILDFAEREVPEMYAACLDGLERGTLTPTRQCDTNLEPFRCFPRLPVDGKIDWSRPAEEIDALVRASTHPYPGAFSYLRVDDELRKVYVWRSSVVARTTKDLGSPGHIVLNEPSTGESHVFTGCGVLAIRQAQYEGEKDEFRPGARWKSIRMRFGLDIEDEVRSLGRRMAALEKQFPK